MTFWALNRLLFQPLLQTLAERRSRTVDLEAKAAGTVERHEELFEEYSEKIREEKQRGYQLADAARQEAMAERQTVLATARDEADGLLRQARDQMENEIQQAESGLQADVEELAQLIARQALRQA